MVSYDLSGRLMFHEVDVSMERRLDHARPKVLFTRISAWVFGLQVYNEGVRNQ